MVDHTELENVGSISQADKDRLDWLRSLPDGHPARKSIPLGVVREIWNAACESCNAAAGGSDSAQRIVGGGE